MMWVGQRNHGTIEKIIIQIDAFNEILEPKEFTRKSDV